MEQELAFHNHFHIHDFTNDVYDDTTNDNHFDKFAYNVHSDDFTNNDRLSNNVHDDNLENDDFPKIDNDSFTNSTVDTYVHWSTKILANSNISNCHAGSTKH